MEKNPNFEKYNIYKELLTIMIMKSNFENFR